MQHIATFIAMAVCLLTAPMALFCLFMYMRESPGWRRALAAPVRRFRALPLAGKLLSVVFLAVFVSMGSTKTNNAAPPVAPPDGMSFEDGFEMQSEGGSPPPSRLTTNQCRAGFALACVATNAAFILAAPSNAVVHAPWTRYGVAEDVFWLPAINWSFILGTNSVDVLYISSSGTLSFGRPKGSPTARPMPDPYGLSFLAPLQTPIGIVPPRGRFWHALTPSNTLLCTWQDVYANRDTNVPVSFQSELSANGDFAFRYDLSTLNPQPSTLPATNFVIGAQHDGGGETWAFGDTNAVVHGLELRWRAFGPLDPGEDDHDDDGLSTYDEVMLHGTDPRLADSDGDGLSDADEVAGGSAPLDPDENGDGVPDGYDLAGYSLDDPDLSFRLANGIGADVDLALDSDADGWPDWLEGRFGTDPLSAQETPAGLTSHFLLTASLTAAPSVPGVLSVGGRRVLATGAGTWAFWLPAGEENGVSFTAANGGCPPLAFTPGHPAAALAPAPAGAHGGHGAAFLPLLAVEPDGGWCCHGVDGVCAVFTAHALPPLPGAFVWTADETVIAVGTNRVEVGHAAGNVRVFFTAAGASAAVEAAVPQITHCGGFYETLCGGIALTNTVFANTDNDDGDWAADNIDTYVHNEDDLAPVTPLTVPVCCGCPSHSPTNWSCRLAGLSDNLRVYASTNKTGGFEPNWIDVENGHTLYF